MTAPQTQSTAPAEKERRQNTKVGVVISDKMEKTRTIAVQRSVRHPFYKKIIRRTSTFHAHDEKNVSKAGDTVKIVETRPLSKLKRWRLVEVLNKAKVTE
ncbi:MAG: 30S ribosomal protein S17 [Vicinamibacteria bacterium]|nr:30S ribosomal protein S17 [Vicinamibacteria bacterium]